MAAWIKMDADPGQDAYVLQVTEGLSSSSEISLLVDASSDPIGCITRETGFGAQSTTVNSVINLAQDTWYHIVCRIDSSGNIRVYLNGVDDSNTTTVSMEAVSLLDTVAIGAEYSGGGNSASNPEDGFPGIIDDVRIYNRALTMPSPQTIQSLTLETPQT